MKKLFSNLPAKLSRKRKRARTIAIKTNEQRTETNRVKLKFYFNFRDEYSIFFPERHALSSLGRIHVSQLEKKSFQFNRSGDTRRAENCPDSYAV